MRHVYVRITLLAHLVARLPETVSTCASANFLRAESARYWERTLNCIIEARSLITVKL